MVAFFLMHLISVQGWLIRAVTRTSPFAERRLLLDALLPVGLLLALSSSPATADTLFLTDGNTSFSLGPHLTLLEDPTASLSLPAVTQALHEGHGTPSTADVPSFGFTRSAMWGQVEIANNMRSEPVFIANVDDALLNDITFYLVHANGEITEKHGGASVPMSQRDKPYRTHIFSLPIAPGEKVQLYVRVKTEFALVMPITLMTPSSFEEASSKQLYVLGMYFGLMGAMIIYNLFIFLTLRDLSYLIYVFFMIAFAGSRFIFNGLAGEQLWPENPVINLYAYPLFLSCFSMTSVLFAETFLFTRHQLKITHYITIAIVVVDIIAIVLTPFSPRLGILTILLPGLMSTLVCLYSGWVRALSGFRPAYYYVLGWTLFLLGIMIFFARAVGVLPSNFFTEYAEQMGSVIEAMALSLALASKIRVMKEEKDRAQAEAMANQDIAINKMKHMDALKDEFLANTSHELRTPLNGIIGLAEAALYDKKEPLPPRQRETLAMIVASGKRLGSLVNDILDFSRLRHEEILLAQKSLDIRSLIDLVVSLSRPLIRGRDLQFRTEFPENLPNVYADENRVQQILHNLIGNAVKFTEHGEILIRVTPEPSHVRIDVIDSGIGIPPDRLESIFESFNQGDGSIQREYGGTGLGLSITKRLVELHGGAIRVNSVPGEGSCFSFTIPEATQDATPFVSTTPAAITPLEGLLTVTQIASAPEADATPSTASEDGDKTTPGHNILVVDDELINRQVLRSQLSAAGFQVTEASDGLQALRMIAENPRFDLVLLDVMMPKLSGYDTCREIRKQYAASILPVIFLTAKSRTEDIILGFESGGNDYLTKPFSRDELLARLNIHLELLTTYRIIREYSSALEKRVEERTRHLIGAQQNLVLQQKMSALGVLTAGVAHEINNPNNFILVGVQNVMAWREKFSQTLHDMLEEDTDPAIRASFENHFSKLKEQLDVIESGSRRIGSIVSILRSVTRLNETERKPVRVVDDLNNTVTLLKPSFESDIDIELVLDANPLVDCWPAEINQVFMNLLMNAAYACRTHIVDGAILRGKICIHSSQTADGRGESKLVITIADNGCGMSQDVLQRAFDPFFTTRSVGSGAGLGLTISNDIIKKHAGEILLASEPRQGTLVTLSLPVSESTDTKISGSAAHPATTTFYPEH